MIGYNVKAMKEENIIKIFTDGGSRGNPGPSASGVYITDYTGKELYSSGRTLGITTNNVAEYTAILDALDWVLQNRSQFSENLKIAFFMDSRLGVMQISGKFRIKNPNLFTLIHEVHKKEAELGCEISYTHSPRELNKMADRNVNLALDGKI